VLSIWESSTKVNKTLKKLIFFVLLACLATLQSYSAQAKSRSAFAQWGAQTLAETNNLFWIPQRNLYADEAKPAGPKPTTPAFMWGCGVQLSALVAATEVDRKTYAPQLARYAQALQVYWTNAHGIGGYDVLPAPKPSDRYYDDNAWIVLDLADAYQTTRQPQYLHWAEKTFRFVDSGEDNQLGGGIFWKENEKSSKNTCSNAPSAAGALRLYQLTHKPEYLATAQRLYTWTNTHLQDKDGLFFDNQRLDGEVEQTKWSYNSALMIRTNCLFHAITHDKKYLREAQRIARAAEAHWVHADTGAIRDGSQFAHLLSESFLYVYDRDHDPHWKDVVGRALKFLHENGRDPHGYYSKQWDTPVKDTLTTVRLIDQASAIRAYWMAARYKLK